MFEALDEQMKRDEEASVSPTEKYVKWAAIVIGSVILFGGIFLGVGMVGS